MYQCECGRKYRTEVKCFCGKLAAICQHRGPVAGSASCGCGVVYSCQLLGGYCSDRKPVDQWATLKLADNSSVTLADVGYQCCGECGEFSVQQPSSSL